MRPVGALLSLGAIVGLFACDGGQTTAPSTPVPSLEILDAAHNEGNPHFFWLPPMVRQPSYEGAFDMTADPVVEICEWSGVCSTPLTARFTMTTGTGSEIIRVDPDDQHYIVNWHTRNSDVSADRTYRVRVLLGPTELGFADLDVVSDMKEFKKVDTGEHVPLNDDGTLPIKFRIEVGALLEPADAILFNGDIITMDPARSVVQAIAIKDGLIQALGPDREIFRHAREGTPLVDLNGQPVLPGIVDPHIHLFLTYIDDGRSLLEAQARAFRSGVTTTGETGFWPHNLPQLIAFEASGQLKLKTSVYLVYFDNCGGPWGEWWKDYPPTREFGEALRFGGVKIFADGGSCGIAAVSVPFYDEEPPIYGDLYLTAAEIAAVISEAEASGHQVAVHATGDRAVREALDGIEAGVGTIPSSSRHRMEHNVLVPGVLMPRYSEIGVIPTVLHYLPLGWMDTKPSTCVGASRNEFYQAWEGNTRALLDANPGHPVAYHGDWPYTYLEPFRNLFNAVTRIRRTRTGQTCPPQDWQLKTRITVEEGLAMMTNHSAYALFRETEVGSLEVGKLADLIVISDNPLEVGDDFEILWNMEIWMTMVEGEVVHCAEGKEAYCPE